MKLINDISRKSSPLELRNNQIDVIISRFVDQILLEVETSYWNERRTHEVLVLMRKMELKKMEQKGTWSLSRGSYYEVEGRAQSVGGSKCKLFARKMKI